MLLDLSEKFIIELNIEYIDYKVIFEIKYYENTFF